MDDPKPNQPNPLHANNKCSSCGVSVPTSRRFPLCPDCQARIHGRALLDMVTEPYRAAEPSPSTPDGSDPGPVDRN